MPNDFNIPMSDAQITQALQLMVERVSEGWAQETYDGSPVGSGSPYYHKSSKYWATRSEDAAARAEAAVPAGTAGAVFFDRSQTLTDAQAMQARANIVAGGSNPNLLDNPFFEVNQRSFTSTSSGGIYTVDRWRISNMPTGGVVSLSNGIMTIDASAATTSYCSIEQRVPFNLEGKTVTLSAMASNGTIYQGTGVVPAQSTSQQIAISISLDVGTLRLYVSTNSNHPCYVQLRITYGNSFSVKAAKLEIGSISTLANDTAPNYQQELAKCQRYCYVINHTAAWYPVGMAWVRDASGQFSAKIPLPVPMRATPTMTIAGNFRINLAQGSNFAQLSNTSLTGIGSIRTSPAEVRFDGTMATTLMGAIADICSGDSGCVITISADL